MIKLTPQIKLYITIAIIIMILIALIFGAILPILGKINFLKEEYLSIKLQIVNTKENEGWPYISPDGKELWFSRTYKGSPAIFRSKKDNNQWQSPELIISQFAGEPTLGINGNLYFVHHYFKDGIMIEADIYIATRSKKGRELMDEN